ncbi:cyclin-domain-containing protein [Infundibulicybe gibba]|nr:cyclin-domain-containing protein [Infundibulicybe gibba]
MESSTSGKVELPTAFEETHIDHLVDLIADMLDRLMAHNDRIPLSPESLTRFHSRSAPSISVLDYLKRIVKFTNVEKSCLLITLHYIDQICARMPLFTLSSLTCHRFIIASITVSSKGLCDTFCTNNLYAKVGGISVTELNILEREFLSVIDWRLMCTRDVLQEYYINLVRTNSTGRFAITGVESPSDSISSDSDAEMESGASSRPSSPAGVLRHPSTRDAPPLSTIAASADSTAATSPATSNTATPTPEPARRPTIEQNMAFAALQQSRTSTIEGPKKRKREH